MSFHKNPTPEAPQRLQDYLKVPHNGGGELWVCPKRNPAPLLPPCALMDRVDVSGFLPRAGSPCVGTH